MKWEASICMNLRTAKYIVSEASLLLDSFTGLACHFHVLNELLWDFLENLSSQITFPDGILEADELYNIASSNFTSVAQTATITVKGLHRAEVSIADADDDDRARQPGELNDEINRLSHVMDGTIREDKHDRVHLVAYGRLHEFLEFL